MSGWGGWEKEKKRKVHKEKKEKKRKGISNVCGLDGRGEQAEEGTPRGSILRNERMRRMYCTHNRSDGKERTRREMETETRTTVVWARKVYVIFPRGSLLFLLNITNPQQSKQNKQTRKTKAKAKEMNTFVFRKGCAKVVKPSEPNGPNGTMKTKNISTLRYVLSTSCDNGEETEKKGKGEKACSGQLEVTDDM